MTYESLEEYLLYCKDKLNKAVYSDEILFYIEAIKRTEIEMEQLVEGDLLLKRK